MPNMTIRLDQKLLEKVDTWVDTSGCRSRNAFVQQALEQYISMLALKDTSAVLPRAITTAIDARLKRLERGVAEHMFRIAMEQDVTNSILAKAYKFDSEFLLELKSDAVKTVKKVNGVLSLTERTHGPDEDEEPWQQ